MKTVRSYAGGSWYQANDGFAAIVNPATEEEIARVSARGLDIAATMAAAAGAGAALRGMTFAERGALLKELSQTLRQHRDELLELSRLNNGTTRPDGAFDIDGAGGALAYYAFLARGLGDERALLDGQVVPMSKGGELAGRHLWLPRRGVAVHINAFNFPAWGMGEKLACALLAGMPVISKPATATALVAERWAEIIIESDILPPGALQIICGSPGELLSRLGPQDVLAFTGSASTAAELRRTVLGRAVTTRFNVEADSLNAAIWGPDVRLDGPTGELFLRDVVREMTQKAGQKCTAVRRILVPRDRLDEVQEALAARLAEVVTGDPADERVTMGPLATQQQLADAVAGIAELSGEAEIVVGNGQRCEGQGCAEGRGYFLGPTLLRARHGDAATRVHEREVFGPVATLLPYDGSSRAAAGMMSRAGGTLVTSLYSDDRDWVREFVDHGGAFTGRIYVGSEDMAAVAPGSGAAFPQLLHGGPGRAGGGEELGGLIGVQLYLQRLAVEGGADLIESFAPASGGTD